MLLRDVASVLFVICLLVEPCCAAAPESGAENTYWKTGFVAPSSGVDVIAGDAAGNVYVGGTFTSFNGISANRIAKWDGTSWSALGSGLDERVSAIAVSGTDVYVGGYFNRAGGVLSPGIAKWSGSGWSSLGGGMGGTYYDNVYALATDGLNVYAGGAFTTAGGVTANNIAKWNGNAWSAMSSGTNGVVLSLTIVGTYLYVGGGFTTAGPNNANYIARWNTALNSWAYAGYMSGAVRALCSGNGNVYAAGDFTSPGNHVAKYNGSIWSELGSGTGGAYPWPQTIAADGENVYLGGQFLLAGGTVVHYLAHWNGSSWSSFGSGLNDWVTAIGLSRNALFVAGGFTIAGDKTASGFAVWQPRVGLSSELVPANPGATTIGNEVNGFYKPALNLAPGTIMPSTQTTLDRANDIRVGNVRVNGAATLTPGGLAFGGEIPTLHIEFSEDDVALYPGSTYTDFRAVRMTYPANYPTNKEAATKQLLTAQGVPAPCRIENGRVIYAIDTAIEAINSTYGAVPLPMVPVALSGFTVE